MNDEDAEWNWHDQRGVTWAAGAAVVALIVLLVWAVMRTATGSSTLPGMAPAPAPVSTSAATSTTRKSVSATTSYPVPSVQTSEGVPPPPPPVDVPSSDEPTTGTPTSTSIFNPYLTTTQPPGGAV